LSPANLDLIDELLLENARELHHGEEPLRDLKSRGTPKVDTIDMLGDSLARH